MSRYAIWNKTDDIYTPVGEVLTAAQWIGRYGWIRHPKSIPVVSAGLINGAFIGELGQMKEIYANQGCEFSDGMTNEEILAAIEAFENTQNAPSMEPSAEERTAAALEAIAAGQTTENAAALNILLGEEG